jgi:hypothetical protein
MSVSISSGKRFLLLLSALFLLAPLAAAQNFTTVNATIVDPNGLPYSNATVQAQIVPAGTAPSIGGLQIAGYTRATADVNGTFSMTLGSNAVITPGGTQWQFTVNEQPGIPPPAGTGPQSFTVTLTISGASQSISANLSAVAPSLSRTAIPGGTLQQSGHVTIGTLAAPCAAGTATSIPPSCYQGLWDVKVDVAATFNTATTNCNGVTVPAGTCVQTSSGAAPFVCPGGLFPCTSATPGCASPGLTCHVGDYEFGTYNCGVVNPNECFAALPHGTITQVISAHFAQVSVAAIHTSIGGTDTNFAWGTGMDTSVISTAYNSMLSVSDSTKDMKLDFPCGAKAFIDGLIINPIGNFSTPSVGGCGDSTVLIPVPNLTCTDVRACFIALRPNSGQGLAEPLNWSPKIQDFRIWGLGLDLLPGDGTVSQTGVAGIFMNELAQCDNVTITGWLWNMPAAFHLYGFNVTSGLTNNCSSYVGGNYPAHFGGGVFPVNVTGGYFGSSAYSNEIAPASVFNPITTRGVFFYQGQGGGTLQQQSAVAFLGPGQWSDYGSDIGGGVFCTSSAGTVNLYGSTITRSLSPPDVTNAGCIYNLRDVTMSNGAFQWLTQTAGTTNDRCGNSFGTFAGVITGGVTTSSCAVGEDSQLAKAVAQTAKTLYTVGPLTSLFRVHLSVQCTTTSAAATVTPSVLYTDTSGTVQTVTGSAATCTTLNASSVTSQDVTFRAKNATNIQYQTVIANTPTYDVTATVEQLSLN